MVTVVKDGEVFIDYKDEGVHANPLKSSGWNCQQLTYPEDSTDGMCEITMPPLQATRHKNKSL
jgi:hypothetical protein